MRLSRSLRALAATGALAITAHTHAAITVVDDTGATVTLAQPAQRVISLAPHVTEMIYAAGGGAKLIGAYSVTGREDRAAKPEEYTITNATKLPEGDVWLIKARGGATNDRSTVSGNPALLPGV